MSDAREERDRFFTLAGELTPLVGIDVGDMRFVVPTDDANLGRQFFTKGGRSELGAVVRAVARLRACGALRGTTFVDVGANIGTTTVAALTRGQLQRAVAVEPVPANLRLLRANLALNDLLERVTVVAAAGGAAAGELHLTLHDHNIGAHRVTEGGVAVRAIALDSLDLDPDDVALLWMDVQGYEGHVLAGAGRLVEGGVPFVLEYHPGQLRKAGLWETVCEAIAGYELVLDLRMKQSEPIPAGEATERIQAALDARGRRFTDLLVFRPR